MGFSKAILALRNGPRINRWSVDIVFRKPLVFRYFSTYFRYGDTPSASESENPPELDVLRADVCRRVLEAVGGVFRLSGPEGKEFDF